MSKPTTKPRLTLRGIEKAYGTEDACKSLLASLRWPDGKVACPRCAETDRVYRTSDAFRWKCKACNKNGYKFSVLTGSVFENTNMPLTIWFRVAFLMISSKKGMSALQMWRMMPPSRGEQGSYKTFWYMCHRLRVAMREEGLLSLTGEVEVDETYVGGDASNAHRGNRGKTTSATPGKRGNLVPPKTPVVGAIQRNGGKVVARVLGTPGAISPKAFIREIVSEDVELIATDAAPGYTKLRGPYDAVHQSVDHASGEYVRGVVHTANIDSFWSLLKRGIMGSFHHVSEKYMQLYVNEFSWRYNHRSDEDIFRAVLAAC